MFPQGPLRLLSSLLCASAAVALDDASMRPRSIYQVFTDRFALPNGSTTAPCGARSYCGGTWNALASKLDYIQGMGFDTVWISPVVQNIEGYTHWGDAFHGYWAQDIRYLNRHFGSPDDLSALSQALHDRNMYLMVDVVANHLATQQVPQYFEPQYFGYGPFNSSDDFHPYCPIDYSNDTSGDKCWAGDLNVALADLNTDNPYVVNYLNGWIHDLVINYSVDAVRLDSARAIKQSFWPDFVDSAGVYNTGEIFDANVTYVASFQSNASLNPLNYPTYLALIPAFNGSKVDLSGFIDVVHEVQGNFTDTSLLPMFANNHDNPRFANITSDEALNMNVETYPLVTDGVPIVYYGSEAGFHGGNDPDNREPFWPTAYNTSLPQYQLFGRLNGARWAAGQANGEFYTSKMDLKLLGPNTMLVSKPPLYSIFTNLGSTANSASYSLPANETQWSPNTDILDVVSCQVLTTDGAGDLTISVDNGNPVVLIEKGTASNWVQCNATAQ